MKARDFNCSAVEPAELATLAVSLAWALWASGTASTPKRNVRMLDVTGYSPRLVWELFQEISAVPRPSGHEEKIAEYLMEFGKKHGIATEKNGPGNILMRVPATKGYELLTPVVLQGHVDMVCEKVEGHPHDFMRDPIELVATDGWVHARGTTLGADDGIGVAAALAVMIDPEVAHGPLECLFTLDEEVTMSGAEKVDASKVQGRTLLNLDSEDEGQLFIGSAGGLDTSATFEYGVETSCADMSWRQVSISGLRGGHSGDDIDKHRVNAIKLLAQLLYNLSESSCPKAQLASFNGGNLLNTIPREAQAVLACREDCAHGTWSKLEELTSTMQQELLRHEPGLQITLGEVEPQQELFDAESSTVLVNLLYALPHGVYEMSQEVSGLVETSTNLARVRTLEDHRVAIETSQRSATEWGKKSIAGMVGAVFSLVDMGFKHANDYPGWAPNSHSPILAQTRQAYRELFGREPEVRAIHAGLECGFFASKIPGIDMISFGPTIVGAHTPEERIEVASVKKFWDLLLHVLKNQPTVNRG